MLFRTMKPDADGRPATGRSARCLGVRIPGDIAPDAEGRVLPGTGGLSVAPRAVWNLPHHRRPRPMGRGSTGPASDRVYGIADERIEASLSLRLDPAAPDVHATVEPPSPMTLDSYERLLVSTRPDWQQVWP